MRKNMDIYDRINYIIEAFYDNTPARFARAIDVAATVIQSYTKRRSKPSYDILHKICTNAHINPEWLILGSGDIFRKDGEQPTPEVKSNSADVNFYKIIEMVKQQAEEIGSLREKLRKYEEADLQKESLKSLEFKPETEGRFLSST